MDNKEHQVKQQPRQHLKHPGRLYQVFAANQLHNSIPSRSSCFLLKKIKVPKIMKLYWNCMLSISITDVFFKHTTYFWSVCFSDNSNKGELCFVFEQVQITCWHQQLPQLPPGVPMVTLRILKTSTAAYCLSAWGSLDSNETIISVNKKADIWGNWWFPKPEPFCSRRERLHSQVSLAAWQHVFIGSWTSGIPLRCSIIYYQKSVWFLTSEIMPLPLHITKVVPKNQWFED